MTAAVVVVVVSVGALEVDVDSVTAVVVGCVGRVENVQLMPQTFLSRALELWQLVCAKVFDVEGFFAVVSDNVVGVFLFTEGIVTNVNEF